MATEIGELVWKINGDTRDFDKNMKKSETGMKSFGSAIKKLGIAAAIIAATKAVAKLGIASVKAASDAEETANKFNVVFRGVGDAAADAANELATGFGLSRTASQGLLADSADLLQGFGVAKDASLELSLEVQKLAADLASFTNYSGGAQGASEALTKGLLGEREAMKSLGIAITETELKRFAEEQGLVYEELDKAEKAFLTFDLAVKQSGNAIGDFARSEASFANQTRIAQANAENLKVTFGQGLLPLANLAVTTFNNTSGALEEAAEAFTAFVTSAQGADKISDVLGTIGGSFSVIGESLGIFFDTAKEGLDGAFAPLFEAFGDLSERAGETGIVFDIFGGVVQYVTSFIKVLTVSIREQIDFIVQFATTVVETGRLAVDALKSIWNKEIRDDLRAQAADVKDSWAETGRDLLDVYTKTFEAIKVEAVSFAEGADANADRLAEAYERGFERVKNASEAALVGAGGSDQDDGTTPGTEAAQAEYEAWADSYFKQLQERYAFEEETRQIVEAAEAERTRITEEAEAERAAIRERFANYTIQAFNNVFDSIDQIATYSGDKELERLENQINSLEKGSEERIKLEEEYDRKSRELERKQAIRQKASGIFNAVISTAQAIIGFLADPGGVPGIALSVLAGITGAAQIAAISSQPLPSFAEGGIVPGNSREGDNILVRANSREMVLTEDQQARLFEMINGSGGGQSINVIVDGNVVAKSVVDRVNRGEQLIDTRRGLK